MTLFCADETPLVQSSPYHEEPVTGATPCSSFVTSGVVIVVL